MATIVWSTVDVVFATVLIVFQAVSYLSIRPSMPEVATTAVGVPAGSLGLPLYEGIAATAVAVLVFAAAVTGEEATLDAAAEPVVPK